MIKLQLVIKYYLFSFLIVDSLSGFIRIYLGIDNVFFNVGYWVRGPILIFFIFYYFLKIIRKNIFYEEAISFLMFVYFILNAILHYIEYSSINMFIENITYILRFQFLLFLFVFILSLPYPRCHPGHHGWATWYLVD